jgi:hypothetical protein
VKEGNRGLVVRPSAAPATDNYHGAAKGVSFVLLVGSQLRASWIASVRLPAPGRISLMPLTASTL